ncbi:MAG: histidine kinase [Clostridiales bacterium]
MFYFPKKFINVSIKKKLIFFTVSIVIVLSLFNIYFYYAFYKSTNEYNTILREYSDINNLSINLLESKESISKYINPYSEYIGDEHELENYDYNIMQSENLIDTLMNSSETLDTYLLIRAIKNSFSEYDSSIKKILDLKQDENNYNEFLRIKNNTNYIEQYIRQLIDVKLSEGAWYQNELSKYVKNIRKTYIVGVSLMIVLSFIYIIAFSNNISVPIKKLTFFAKNISEGMFKKEELVLNSSDEINILAKTLNQMASNIDIMINLERNLMNEELMRTKISNELSKAKFLSLQSQINPHFLFNTLNAISKYSMFENANKTTKLIEALAVILRYNLGSVKKHTLLNDELEIVRKYAIIQNSRFGNKFKFEIINKLEKEIVYIPRFIIQPLVENSFIHGLEAKDKRGKVRVKIKFSKYDKNTVIIKIIDNGVGISKDELLIMFDEDKNLKGDTTGIGLNNVRTRIILYTGREDSFVVRSKVDWGTIITIKINILRRT